MCWVCVVVTVTPSMLVVANAHVMKMIKAEQKSKRNKNKKYGSKNGSRRTVYIAISISRCNVAGKFVCYVLFVMCVLNFEKIKTNRIKK